MVIKRLRGGERTKEDTGVHNGKFGPCVDLRINGQPTLLNCRTDQRASGVCSGECDSCVVGGKNKHSVRLDAADLATREIEPFSAPLTPEGELERSERILAAYRLKEPNRLTVGDLSIVSKEEKKRKAAWAAKKVNRSDAVSVGDLSIVPAVQGGLQDLFVGAALVPKPCMSPSQERLMAMQRKQRKKREEIFEVKKAMFAREAEEEARRETAKANLEERIKAAESRL